MTAADFVAGDWGTSHLRLFLCDAQGTVLDRANGAGVAGSNGQCARIFDSLVSKWVAKPQALPAVLCGMVGSNIGWLQAPYVACPATPQEIATRCVSVRDGLIRIVPGLSCRNRFDAPDFMRGEETQILGALALEPALRQGRKLLCLPGTHTKWVVLQEGVVTGFLTAPTGELFDVLSDHSVLVRERSGVAANEAAFQRGLAQVERFPQAQVLHRLFECRSRSLDGELGSQDVSAFLSGLLIASDIAGALDALAGETAVRAVHLIGSPELTQLYATGLGRRQYATHATDGSAASVAGLVQIRRQLTRGSVTNAT
jgi:2-dehydro-3-deoxygalactonokinase